MPSCPNSFVAALESGPTSFGELLDAVRIAPAPGCHHVRAASDTVRRRTYGPPALLPNYERITRSAQVGQWQACDPESWIDVNSGYDTACASPRRRAPRRGDRAVNGGMTASA